MTITHKINMDLTHNGIAPKFDMVQGDYLARQIEFHLFANKTPFSIPADTKALIRFRRPDQSAGAYDTLPNGDSAYVITGSNRLTVFVAPDVLTVPGAVSLVVSLYTPEQELSTFEVHLDVQSNLSADLDPDGNYISISGMLPAPDSAVPGQLLIVDEVSSNGKYISVRAANSTDTAPAFIRDAADSIAASVQSHQNAHSFSFLIGSDLRHRVDHTESEQSLSHLALAVERVCNQVHLDFVALLGNFLSDSGESVLQATTALRHIRQAIHPALGALPQFWLKGDRDYLSSDDHLTEEQVFAGISIHNGGAVFDESNRVSGYCYRDFDAYKIRVICLALPESRASTDVSSSQIAWLESVLNLTEKGTDWRILLLSHAPIDAFSHCTALMNAVALSANTIIANLHGYCQNSQGRFLEGTYIPKIGTPAGSADSPAFSVVTIDAEKQKLFVDSCGTDENIEIDL